MTSSDLPDEQTVLSSRRSADAEPDEQTVLSTRRRAEVPTGEVEPDEATAPSTRRSGTGDLPDDDTVISARERPADRADDATVISTRPRPADLPDDATDPSVRVRAIEPDVDDRTIVAARRAPALPDDADDTVLARGRVLDGTDTVLELEDTVLRPGASARASAAAAAHPTDPAVPARDARIPDAAALREPTPPRAAPPITITRAPAARPAPDAGPATTPPDHAGAERAALAGSRRRVLAVVLSTLAFAAVAAWALLLLLT